MFGDCASYKSCGIKRGMAKELAVFGNDRGERYCGGAAGCLGGQAWSRLADTFCHPNSKIEHLETQAPRLARDRRRHCVKITQEPESNLKSELKHSFG